MLKPNPFHNKRLEKGFTVTGLARRAEISTSAIYNYQNGERTPSIEVAAKLACILDCSIADIFPYNYEYVDKRVVVPTAYPKTCDLVGQINSFFMTASDNERLIVFIQVADAFFSHTSDDNSFRKDYDSHIKEWIKFNGAEPKSLEKYKKEFPYYKSPIDEIDWDSLVLENPTKDAVITPLDEEN